MCVILVASAFSSLYINRRFASMINKLHTCMLRTDVGVVEYEYSYTIKKHLKQLTDN